MGSVTGVVTMGGCSSCLLVMFAEDWEPEPFKDYWK